MCIPHSSGVMTRLRFCEILARNYGTVPCGSALYGTGACLTYNFFFSIKNMLQEHVWLTMLQEHVSPTCYWSMFLSQTYMYRMVQNHMVLYHMVGLLYHKFRAKISQKPRLLTDILFAATWQGVNREHELRFSPENIWPKQIIFPLVLVLWQIDGKYADILPKITLSAIRLDTHKNTHASPTSRKLSAVILLILFTTL